MDLSGVRAMSDKSFVALSLGWGVQSFTLAAMVALGELPPVDVAIHADTTHEMSGTYAHAKKYTPWLEGLGVKVATVYKADTIDANRLDHIPAFTPGSGLYSNFGMIRRQCTNHWKIQPMRRWIQANRNGRPVTQWLGISTDEAPRMKPANVKYIINRWPLIELRISRWDCIRWLDSHGLDVPPKSSCVFCPYHDQSTWRELKLEGGDDWRKAVEADRHIRNARTKKGDLFVHPARIPLEDVDLRNMEDRGQLRLWDEECSGICGV